MNASKFVKTKLGILRWWPFFILPIFAAAFAITFVIDKRAGIVTLIFFCVYLLFCLFWVLYWKNHISERMAYYAEAFGETQKAQLDALPLPYALINHEGKVVWANASFKELTAEDSAAEMLLSRIVPVSIDWDFESGKKIECDFEYRNKNYLGELIPTDKSGYMTFAMKDMTEIVEAREVIEGQRPVYAQILIDNYEEVFSSTEKIRQGILSAIIERKITKYFGNLGGLVHRLEPERYALTIDKKGIQKAKEDRFSILDEIKNTNCGNTIAPTISIGIGVDWGDPSVNYERARAALELCLGRGGDQVAIRSPQGEEFFGAKSKTSEKTSRVRARVMAKALREMIAARDRVIVMGHKNPDADSLGSALGIAHLAKNLQKEVRIVNPENDAAVSTIFTRLLESAIGFDKMLISAEEAEKLLDENTLLVIVDTNNFKVTEAPQLYELAKHVANIDHHRPGNNKIENVELSFLNSGASSTSEMITEILDCISDVTPLDPAEADALYAGIVVDTDNFLNMTGVRTFEAAAYLRRSGANIEKIRRLLQDTMEDFQSRAKAISNVEIFEKYFAFGICEEGTSSASVTGAKIANELLKISGIRASFVFTQLEGEVNMSARSIGDINVQLVCERLGGGGHHSSAGAQLKGCNVQDAISYVKETIKAMIKEGAI